MVSNNPSHTNTQQSYHILQTHIHLHTSWQDWPKKLDENFLYLHILFVTKYHPTIKQTHTQKIEILLSLPLMSRIPTKPNVQ